MDSNNTSLSNDTETESVTDTDRLIVFVLYFSSGFVGVCLYIAVFYVLIKHNQQFRGSFYKFLFCLGIAETYGLLYYGFYGAFCTLLSTCPLNDAANIIFTALSWVFYFTEFSFHVAISVDRFVAICFFQHYEFIFTRTCIITVIVVGWLFCWGMSMPFLINYFSYSYISDEFTDYYLEESDESDFYDQFQFGFCVFLLCICGALYGATILTLWCKHGQTGTVQKAQQKLMIQGIVHFSCIFSYLLLFEFIPDVGTVWINVASTMMFQSICLSTTVLTIAMNGVLREKLIEIIRPQTRARPSKTINASVFVRTRVSGNHRPVENMARGVFVLTDVD